MSIVDHQFASGSVPTPVIHQEPGSFRTERTGSEVARPQRDVPSRSSEQVRSTLKPRQPVRYHRIAEVREEQGVSLRSVSRQMGRTVSFVRAQEDETTDLHLSELRQWQKVLGVPIADLLVEPESSLSSPLLERARMVRIMKTAAALQESVKTIGAQRLVTMLLEQLIEIMPELKDVGAWHSVGQRRSSEDFGRIVERTISDDFLGPNYD